MKRVIKWTAVNGAFATLAWMAVVQGVEGAGNIVQVLVGFLLVMTVFSASDAGIKTLAKLGREVPIWTNGGFDLAMVGLFLWHGWMWTGTAYLVHAFFTTAAWMKADELIKSRSAA